MWSHSHRLSRRGTASATLRRSRSQLTRPYTSRAATPASQSQPSSSIQCTPLPAVAVTVDEGSRYLLTGLSRSSTPVLTWSAPPLSTEADTVSRLGIRLTGLSREKGRTSRRATMPHRAHRRPLGALRSSRRSAITARISHPAEILMFSSFQNRVFMSLPPLRRCQSCGGSVQSPGERAFFGR